MKQKDTVPARRTTTLVRQAVLWQYNTMETSRQPVYRRLRDLIVAGIIDGTYAEGTALPSVRQFAARQGANPLTVAKAYQQLQGDALVEVQRGIGMFVSPGAAERLRRQERERFLAQDWPEIRRKLQMLDLSPVDLLAEG